MKLTRRHLRKIIRESLIEYAQNKCEKDSPSWSSNIVETPWSSDTVMVLAPGDCVIVSACGQAGLEKRLNVQHSADETSPGLSIVSQQTFKLGENKIDNQTYSIRYGSMVFVAPHIRLGDAESVKITPSTDEQDFLFCGLAMEAQ